MDALDEPGDGRKVNELLAFFQIEAEDRKKEQQQEDLKRQVQGVLHRAPHR
jgi:hypothetical protein